MLVLSGSLNPESPWLAWFRRNSSFSFSNLTVIWSSSLMSFCKYALLFDDDDSSAPYFIYKISPFLSSSFISDIRFFDESKDWTEMIIPFSRLSTFILKVLQQFESIARDMLALPDASAVPVIYLPAVDSVGDPVLLDSSNVSSIKKILASSKEIGELSDLTTPSFVISGMAWSSSELRSHSTSWLLAVPLFSILAGD